MTSASPNDRFAYLDGWRGLAILCVLIGHFTNLPAILFGRLGVELFFALSGRLMAEILFVRGFPLGKFIARRFSRVFPGLLALVLLLMVATRLAIWPLGTPPVEISTAGSVLTFTYGYLRDVVVPGQHILEHTWSLAVEEHAYFILAFIALLSRNHIGKPALIILVIALASILDGTLRTIVLHQGYYEAYWITDTKLASIFVPGLVYLYRDHVFRWLGRSTPYAALIFGGLGVLLFHHDVPTAVRYGFAPLMFGLAITCLPAAPRLVITMLENRALTQIGLMSYSIYLWQQPFMAYGEHVGQTARLAALPGALGCATASYYLIEGPARHWLNALIDSRSRRRRRFAVAPSEA